MCIRCNSTGFSGSLVYIGNVGTGFSSRQRRELRDTLIEIVRPTSPFAIAPPYAIGRVARYSAPIMSVTSSAASASVADSGIQVTKGTSTNRSTRSRCHDSIQMQHDSRSMATVFPGNGAMRNRIDHAPSACSSAATPSRINVAADATRIPSIECSDHTLDARIEMRCRPQTNTRKFLAPTHGTLAEGRSTVLRCDQ